MTPKNEDHKQLPPTTGQAVIDKSPAGTKWNGRFSITITLVTAIGLLTLISAGTVLAVGVWLAQKNTFALLSDNAHQNVSASADRIEQHLRPAEYQARFLAERIANGEIDPSDRERLGLFLGGALAAAPQIETVIYIDIALQAYLTYFSTSQGKIVHEVQNYANDPVIRDRMRAVGTEAIWGSAVWRDVTKKTYLNVAVPILREDEFIGSIVAVVSVEGLSRFLADADKGTTGQRFILAGRNHVLAHPLMAKDYPGRTNEAPLPAVGGFKDPVLAAIWSEDAPDELLIRLPQGTEGHFLEIGSQEFIYVYRKIQGFGPEPLLAGIYFRTAEVSEEIQRMTISLFAGIAALILSVLAAIYIGRRIARPIVGFSSAAGRIRDLEISQVRELPGSLFRELNDQAASFNAMLRALRWFELYVPKKIVERLIRSGDVQEMTSDARNVTVMFTDIAQFSTISQGLSAPEVAALVNHHFALVGACIDAEGGTIDKFMGDSVMAIWGAPEKQKQRAERACRAALAIATAIHEDNKKRKAQGLPPIGIRIGIHSGKATVGNIGAPGHINYTIIGDAVNIGQRLEQLCKDVYPPESEVCILISGDTAGDLSDAFKPVPAGRFELKGRAGETDVFKLI